VELYATPFEDFRGGAVEVQGPYYLPLPAT
jgi:hypothetical protein